MGIRPPGAGSGAGGRGRAVGGRAIRRAVLVAACAAHVALVAHAADKSTLTGLSASREFRDKVGGTPIVDGYVSPGQVIKLDPDWWKL